MRLINEDDVLNRITNPYERAHVSRWIKEAPTIEAAPVRKGKWIEVDDKYNRIRGKCSVCGWEAHLYEDDVVGMPYCPNCGTSLEGVEDE